MAKESIPVELVRSRRKTLALHITADGKVQVRAPLRTPRPVIRLFVEQHRDWIETHLAARQEKLREAAELGTLSPAELEDLKKRAKKVIPARAAYYAPLVGVSYGRVSIRTQRSRWGSCSGKGNLNFNCLLMLAPAEVLDYVVVHELCHRLEMNHSPRFWAQVERVCPDWKASRRWLRENGDSLMAQIPRD